MTSTPQKKSVVTFADEVKNKLVVNINQNMSDLIGTIQQEQDRMEVQSKSLQQALEKARIREEDHQRELESLREERRNIILENAADRDERLDEAQIDNEEKLDKLRSVLSDLVVAKRELKGQLEQERLTVTTIKLDIATLHEDKRDLECRLHEANSEIHLAYNSIKRLQQDLQAAEAQSASAGELKHECERLRMESKRTTKRNAEKVSDLEQRLAVALDEISNLRVGCEVIRTMHDSATVPSEELIVQTSQPEALPPQSQAVTSIHGMSDLKVDHQGQRAKRKENEKVNVGAWQNFANFANTQSRARHELSSPLVGFR